MSLARSLSRLRSVLVLALPWIAACGGGEEDAVNRAKIASELVQCKNEQSNLKDQIGELKTENAKLKAQLEAAKQQPATEATAPEPAAAPKVVHREGNLPPDQVLKVLRANSGSLRACYEKGLKRKPDLQYVQSVTAHFAVKNTGTATGISFSPRTDGEMEQCMAKAIGKWRFPEFSGDPVQFEAPVSLVAK